MTTRIESDLQLLVEGKDCVNFFEAVVKDMALQRVQIHNFGGVNELRGFLPAFVKAPGFLSVRRIGIVRDAEENADSAFQSVQSSLTNAGLPVPDVPTAMARDGGLAVGVFILPGGGEPGMLETLLCRTFARTPLAQCIDSFFECAGAAGAPAPIRPEKARASAWVSTRPKPHVSVGVAAKEGYWDLRDPSLTGVRRFIETLYGPET